MNWGDYFEYDESCPSCLRWRVDVLSGRWHKKVQVAAGEAAGSVASSGYFAVKVEGKTYKPHRIVWEMFNGVISDGLQIDHINGARGDNRLCNLRVVANAQNCRNRNKRKTNRSGVNGVSRISNGYGSYYWSASCVDAGKLTHKRFPIAKLGEEEAFRLACEHRNKMIEKLNAEGAGYTDRHGQEKT